MDLQSRVVSLERELADEKLRDELMRTNLGEENQRLIDRCGQAEAKAVEVSEELFSLRSEFAGLGDSLLVVPAATMRMARDQFRTLADECERSGDIIGTAMCEIGSRLIAQAIAGSAPEPEA